MTTESGLLREELTRLRIARADLEIPRPIVRNLRTSILLVIARPSSRRRKVRERVAADFEGSLGVARVRDLLHGKRKWARQSKAWPNVGPSVEGASIPHQPSHHPARP